MNEPIAYFLTETQMLWHNLSIFGATTAFWVGVTCLATIWRRARK